MSNPPRKRDLNPRARAAWIAANALGSAVVLLWPPDIGDSLRVLVPSVFVPLLLGIGTLWPHLRRDHPVPAWVRLTEATALGIAILIVAGYLAAALAIPVNHRGGIVLTIAALLAVATTGLGEDRRMGRPSIGEALGELDQETLAIWSVAAALAAILFIPAKGLLVPPLHDPAAAAYLAQRLLVEPHSLESLPHRLAFYPPGLPILAAQIGGIGGVHSAKVILYLTHLATLGFCLAFARVIKGWIGHGAVSAFALVAFAAPKVPALYYRAGKNSQVLGFFLFTIAVALATDLARNPSRRKAAIFVLTYGASVLAHYNNLFFVAAYSAGVFVAFVPQGVGSYSSRLGHLVRTLAPAGIVLSLGLAVHYLVLKNLATADMPHVRADKSVPPLTTVLEGLAGQAYGYVTKAGGLKPRFMSAFAVGATCWLLYCLFFSPKRSSTRRLAIAMGIIFLAHLAARSGLIHAAGIKFVSPHFSKVYDFLWFAFAAALAAPALWRKSRGTNLRPLLIVAAVLVCFVGGRRLAKNYHRARSLSTVTQADLRAFDWIKTNVPTGTNILPGSLVARNVIFETDASLYLKHFTHHEELLGFVGGDRFWRTDKAHFETYKKLAADPRDCGALTELQNLNVGYVYFGARASFGRGALSGQNLKKSPEIFSRIYAKDGAVVYKINLKEVTSTCKP